MPCCPLFPDNEVAIARYDEPSRADFAEMINFNTAQQQQLGLNLMPAASSQSCSTSSMSLMSELMTWPPANVNIPPVIPMPFSNTPISLQNRYVGTFSSAAGACLNTRSTVINTLANQTPALSDVSSPSATPFLALGMVTHPRMPSAYTDMSPTPAINTSSINIHQGVRSHRPDTGTCTIQMRQHPVRSHLKPGHPQHMQQHIGIGVKPRMTHMSPLPPSICTRPNNQMQCIMMSKQALHMERRHQMQRPALNTVGKYPIMQATTAGPNSGSPVPISDPLSLPWSNEIRQEHGCSIISSDTIPSGNAATHIYPQLYHHSRAK